MRRPGAQGVSHVVLDHVGVARDERFGSVTLSLSREDVAASGIAYGDAVRVTFSTGLVLDRLPYLSGYYVRRGEVLVLGYPGSANVEVTVNYGSTLFCDLGLAAGDTAQVALEEPGAYRALQETFDLAYSRVRDASATDEAHANFRALSGGHLKALTCWRGASPIDDTYGRASTASSLIARTRIAYVLDLADDADRAHEHMSAAAAHGIDVSSFSRLLAEGRVGLLSLSAAYPTRAFASSLARGLTQMAEHDGPYYLHCTEGKDRTGFCCMLLEALCGASLSEMEKDYMQSYACYFGITRESDPTRYEAILDLNLHDMLRFLAGADAAADLTQIDFAPHARRYLEEGGMDDTALARLLTRIAR